MSVRDEKRAPERARQRLQRGIQRSRALVERYRALLIELHRPAMPGPARRQFVPAGRAAPRR